MAALVAVILQLMEKLRVTLLFEGLILVNFLLLYHSRVDFDGVGGVYGFVILGRFLVVVLFGVLLGGRLMTEVR